ncbi:MAG: histone deacetylase [Candidatus Brocadiia bacterium]
MSGGFCSTGPRFVYSPDYYCDIGDHVFRTGKYRLLYERMIEADLATPDDFLKPQKAPRDDLELVHTPEYLDDLLAGRETARTMRSEMPISEEIVRAFVLGAGGTILACRTALAQNTFAMNLAGGFHHAFPDWAEGFCYINDVAVGVRKMQQEGRVERAMVVDCDLHQGNGTAWVFRDDPDVFTFSIHQENNYPIKRQSDLDVGLPDFCSGKRYLRELEDNLLPALERHDPEFVLYVAGADPSRHDMLGTLGLEFEDLRRRDDMVLGTCAEREVPVTVVLAGGYAADVNDTVRIHEGTVRAMFEVCCPGEETRG